MGLPTALYYFIKNYYAPLDKKLCVKCEFYRENGNSPICDRAIDLVTGKSDTLCAVERGEDYGTDSCGPQGKYFKEKLIWPRK